MKVIKVVLRFANAAEFTVMALLVATLTTSAAASTYFFTGMGEDSEWTNEANWAVEGDVSGYPDGPEDSASLVAFGGTFVHLGGADLTIGSTLFDGSVRLDATLTLTGLGSIWVDRAEVTGSKSVRIAETGELTLKGAGRSFGLENAGRLVVTEPVLDNPYSPGWLIESLQNSGVVEVQEGRFYAPSVQNSGSIAVHGGGVVVLGSGDGTFVNTGTIEIQDGSVSVALDDELLQNTGSLLVRGGVLDVTAPNAAAISMDSGLSVAAGALARFAKSNGDVMQIPSGAIFQQAGTIELVNAALSGSVTVASGSVSLVEGDEVSASVSGVVDVANGARLQVGYGYRLLDGTVFSGSGGLRLEGPAVEGTVTLNLPFVGQDAYVVSADPSALLILNAGGDVTGGSFGNGGDFVPGTARLPSGQTLTVRDNLGVYDGWTVENFGTIEMTNSYLHGDGTIKNHGLWVVSGTEYYAEEITFENSGTFRKVGEDTLYVETGFSGAGTVEVAEGELILATRNAADVAKNSVLAVAAGAKLRLDPFGDPFAITGGVTFSPQGVIELPNVAISDFLKVESGTVRLIENDSSHAALSGVVDVAEGATLYFDYGHVLKDGTSLTGAGRIEVEYDLAIEGTVENSATLGLLPEGVLAGTNAKVVNHGILEFSGYSPLAGIEIENDGILRKTLGFYPEDDYSEILYRNVRRISGSIFEDPVYVETTTNFTSTGTIEVLGGILMLAQPNFEEIATQSTLQVAAGATLRFEGDGTWDLDGFLEDPFLFPKGPRYTAGILEVPAGLVFGFGGTNAGTIQLAKAIVTGPLTVESGTVALVDGDHTQSTFSGPATIAPGAALRIGDDYTIQDGSTFSGGGTLEMGRAARIAGTIVADVPVTLQEAQSLVRPSTLQLNAGGRWVEGGGMWGREGAEGKTILAAGQVFTTVGGDDGLGFDYWTIENHGVVKVESFWLYGGGDSVIDNRGEWRMAEIPNAYLGVGRFENSGRLDLGLQSGFYANEFIQKTTGVLAMQIGGPDPGVGYADVQIGSATLDGRLQVSFVNGYLPEAGDTFTLLASGESLAGTFSSYTGLRLGPSIVLRPVYEAGQVILVAELLGSGTAASPQPVPDGGALAVGSGGTYAGAIAASTVPGGVQTVATILDGDPNGETTLHLSFSPAGVFAVAAGGNVASDLLSLEGTGDDKFVLQLDYDEAAVLAAFGDELGAFLGWRNPETGQFVLAVDGNIDLPGEVNIPTFIIGAYNPLTDFYLGYYGVDTVADRVWAVIDHNSLYGVAGIPLPEPASSGLIVLSLTALASSGRFRRRRAGSRQR